MNCLYLNKKLYNFRMRKYIRICEHFNEFNKIICQFTNIMPKLKEEYKALILLSSLHLLYEHLIKLYSM